MANFFNKHKKALNNYFLAIQAAPFFLIESLGESNKKEMVWIMNPNLKTNLKQLAPPLLLNLTLRIGEVNPKLEDKLIRRFEKEYTELVDEYNTFHSFMNDVDHDITVNNRAFESSEESIQFINKQVSRYIFGRMMDEHNQINGRIQFTEKFMDEVGNLITLYTLKMCLPLVNSN